jgi:hypothetical protein
MNYFKFDIPIVELTTVQAARASKPDKSEFLPYYGKYIDLVASGDVLSALANQMRDTQTLLGSVPSALGTHRYAEGKWSINEVVGHVVDSERIFAYRALRFARRDRQALAGFEQDDYVRTSSYNSFPLAELSSELDCVRQATIYLFKHFDEDAWMSQGVASGAVVSVRALAYIIAGHELHHREILRTKYLNAS